MAREMTLRLRARAALAAAVLLCSACSTTDTSSLTVEEARAIAKEAYVYGYPMVDAYRIHHAYFVDRDNPEFKAPWNQLRNTPRVYTPAVPGRYLVYLFPVLLAHPALL